MDYYADKTIVITGAGGFVGSVLVDRLKDIDCHLVLVAKSDFVIPSQSKAKIDKMVSSVTDISTWEKVLDDKVDTIFHLAAYEHRRGSKLDPVLDLEVNTNSTLYILETCRKKNVKPHIVFASTSNIAGMAKHMPVNEDTPDDPLTLFAVNKLNSERYLDYYSKEYGITSSYLRFANIYGVSPNQEGMDRTTFNFLIKLAFEKKLLKLFKNKGCIRDYIYVDDVVNAMLSSAEKKVNGKYYVGSEESVSLGDAIKMIAEIAEKKLNSKVEVIDDDEAELDKVEFRNFVADCNKFKKQTGWNSEVNLESGIDKVFQHYLKNKV